MSRRVLVVTLVGLLDAFFAAGGGVAPVDLFAATLPSGFAETQVAAGLANPTAMAFAPDGRLFVCLQNGQVRIVKDGALLPTPFLSVTVDSSGERGLLGIAFDPNFATNHFVYVYYTATSPVHNRVSRFTANGDVAMAGSELAVLHLDNLSIATNHNGGAIHFGEDGKLYIAVGDNANSANSQSFGNLLGKILRINRDGTIPPDNPFLSQTTGKNQAIWALGLRNPFTFAFQPMTGRMFINDVGQNTYEEINEGIAGSNYGWPESEGPTSNPNHLGPIYFYGHGPDPFFEGCAITGGAFYNPPLAQFPAEYVGDYFFADFCSGWINKFDPASSPPVTSFATGIELPVDLQIGPEGSLYYLARGSGGAVYRIQHAGSQAPIITQHPQNQTVAPGQAATFTVTASGDAPLAYQWQRNGVNILRAKAPSYMIKSATANDNGALFRCVVSNAAGTAISNEALLTVTGGNSPPAAEANGPYSGVAGGRIVFSSVGSIDPDGTIVAYSWNFGDGTPPSTQPNPRHVYSAPGTYTATLTVTDNQGGTDTDTAQVTVQ